MGREALGDRRADPEVGDADVGRCQCSTSLWAPAGVDHEGNFPPLDRIRQHRTRRFVAWFMCMQDHSYSIGGRETPPCSDEQDAVRVETGWVCMDHHGFMSSHMHAHLKAFTEVPIQSFRQ